MKYPNQIEHGIMFHHFHDERHPKGQGSISQADLEALLNFIGLHRILTPSEWLERLEENKLSKEDLCLTFDDALLCQFEIALPVLESYHLRAFWFVYSSIFEGHAGKMEAYRFFRTNFFQNINDFYDLFFRKVFSSEFSKSVEEVLEEEEIRKQIELFPFYSVNDAKFRLIRDRALGKQNYERIMDEIIKECGINMLDLSRNLWMSDDNLRYLTDSGHIVGLHSYFHPMLVADLSYEEQLEEYKKNYLHLKEVCGRNPVAMSHPSNSYNENTIKILKYLGIRCGFRSNMFPKKEGGRINPNRFEIARQDHSNIMKMLGGKKHEDK